MPAKRLKPSIKNSIPIVKRFLCIFILLTVIITAITVLVYFNKAKNEKLIIKMGQKAAVTFALETISGEFDSTVSDLMILADNSHLQLFLETGSPDFLKDLEKDFLTLSKRGKLYDQIRYLDEKGMEIVRVNFNSGNPGIVSKDKLQNKGKRYYFFDTFKLNREEVFVSPLDLNIEQGKIELPLKPMIRFGTPIFSKAGQKKGIILLNYMGGRLLNKLEHEHEMKFSNVMLLNSKGFWLKGLHPEDEWGFMYKDRSDRKFGNTFPEAWQKISEQESGHFSSANGWFAFADVYPLEETMKSSFGSGKTFESTTDQLSEKGYYWKIVSHVSPDYLSKVSLKIWRNLFFLYIPLIFVLSIVSWLLSSSNFRRMQAEKALRKSRDNLELQVKLRTTELREANDQLKQKIEDNRRVEEALRESEEKYRLLVENAEDAIFIVQDEIVKFSNPKTKELTGYSAEELDKISFVNLIHPKDKEMVLKGHRKKSNGYDISGNYSIRIINKNNEKKWAELSAVSVTWEGEPATLNFMRDISQQKKLEDQLGQAQEMESIGTLAGGIAHDFNNILSAIIGYSELTKIQVKKGSKIDGYVDQVIIAGIRAKELVKQILEFSRMSEQNRKTIQLPVLLKDALKLLQATLPSTIEIHQKIDNKCGTILADPTQMHQIVLNLCTNAYHAMHEKGGILEVSLNAVEISIDDVFNNPEMEPGSYLQLTVSDNGHGMDRTVVERIFEPYFTTKVQGEGTGMGLSVVHGIVKNHDGFIEVYSEPDKGTSFHIYLPRSETGSLASETAYTEPAPRGSERLLYIDDEEPIVEMMKENLENLGYNVTASTSSTDSLLTFRSQPENFDLIITDMDMPNMTGLDLAKKLINIRPDIPIILCTGFNDMATEKKAKALGVQEFVTKPASKKKIADTIRKILDNKRCETNHPIFVNSTREVYRIG